MTQNLAAGGNVDTILTPAKFNWLYVIFYHNTEAPTVHSFTSNVKSFANSNETALLLCQATGSPHPVVRIISKETTVSTVTDKLIENTVKARVSVSVGGVYFCIASNRAGTHNRTLTIGKTTFFDSLLFLALVLG